MYDPEMMRLAQEQMSRLRPEDLQRMQQQMMSNPDLIRMATEGMKNFRPEDLKYAAQQMRNIPPDEIANMSSRVAQASPEELASMKLQSEAQRSYVLQGSQNLKNQGNQLHGVGKYSEATEKYLRAKNNLVGHTSKEARDLELSCSLNLMSCYLKTKQFSEAVALGTEVLSNNPNNLKALYRRGQAYKELGQLKLAVPDLKKAFELSPDDETIANNYRYPAVIIASV
jgi:tetratricopeptide (TPR) repeat protein